MYGPGQNPHAPYSAVIAKFLDLARRGETLSVEWDGRQSRDFIAVEDVARANVLAARKGKPGETYNVAFGGSHSLLALIRLIERISGKNWPAFLSPNARETCAPLRRIFPNSNAWVLRPAWR